MEKDIDEKEMAYLEGELKKAGIEKIEMVDGKPIFHFAKKLIDSTGEGLESPKDSGGSIHRVLLLLNRHYFRQMPILRATPDQNFDGIIKRGVDEKGLLPLPKNAVVEKEERDIFADQSFQKAAQYGRVRRGRVMGEEIENSITILFYDRKKMMQVLPSTRYQYRFLTDPKEALLGVLVLHSSKDSEDDNNI